MYKVICVFVVAVMAQHKCKKLVCPQDNVKGPKVNCLKCNTCCYLLCFGFERGPTIEKNETVKKIVDGNVVVMFPSCIAFVCCGNEVSSEEIRGKLKLPKVRDSSSKGRASNVSNDAMANEMKSIKELLTSIKKATDTNTAEIAEIKSLSTKTEANVKKATELNAMNCASPAPRRSPAMSYVQAFKERAATKSSLSVTPGKRQRSDSPPRQRMTLPPPKVGKKMNIAGLSVVPKRERKIDEKPKFEKAIWLSRLSPNTTEEEIIDFITANTPVTDKTKMNVHKLVKKDADLSLLNFVSFKVELNVTDFDVLNDPEVWPEHVMVREFMQASKITLGDHLFPALNATGNRPTTLTEQSPMQTATGT